jgi:rhomboid family GlyGly-CTERM serine protease
MFFCRMLKNDKLNIRVQCLNPFADTCFVRFTASRTITRSHVNLYLVLTAISAFCLFIQAPDLSLFMTWDHSLIISGQWWRILSGNFAHTNFTHLAMNLAALWLISLIFKPSVKVLLLLMIAISLVIGLGLLASDIQRYVGLSGTLHGLFAYFAAQELLVQGRRSSGLLVLGVAGKVIWEQIFGPSHTSMALIEAPVATQAHLIGLIAGLIFAFFSYRHHSRSPFTQ